MRAQVTMVLGYALLVGTGIAGVLYARASLDFTGVAQIAALSAGALSLLLMTRTRSSKSE